MSSQIRSVHRAGGPRPQLLDERVEPVCPTHRSSPTRTTSCALTVDTVLSTLSRRRRPSRFSRNVAMTLSTAPPYRAEHARYRKLRLSDGLSVPLLRGRRQGLRLVDRNVRLHRPD